ncbi:DUF7149 domain-containing protein [Salinimicrobium terrae]|uniref:DUF7149 domain-containing protein n=1 Tax=Salinimicrobium terrae TaxID=470866 RepID=UPI0004029154|nr:hypothetical protein [Salinimicrobium terrae]
MESEQAINTGNFYILKPRKALKKAFLKVKPNRSQIEQFKQNLTQLLDRTNEIEFTLLEENSAADTSSLEAEIDRLVYELYVSTEEEIEIIGNSFN